MERINGRILQRTYPDRVIFRESFTGNGSAKTFTLDGTIGNATFKEGFWSVGQVQTSLPAHITKINKKPAYDSLIPLTRNRISISSINATTGVVTLDYAPRDGVDFYIWYWYELSTTYLLDDYYREDFVAHMEEEATAYGVDISVDTTDFGGIFSDADTTVQKALDTADDHTHSHIDLDDITSNDHHPAFVGLKDNAGTQIYPQSALIQFTDDGKVNIDDSAPGILALSIDEAQIDHGSIGGLTDDDHTQYHNDTRGDARYYTETELDGGQLDNRYYTETEVDALGFVDRGNLSSYDWDQTDFIIDSAWHDLNLSSIVPAGAKAVLLEVIILDGSASMAIQVKNKDHANDSNRLAQWTQASNIYCTGSGICSCDSNRYVQYKIDTGMDEAYITVRGWFM